MNPCGRKAENENSEKGNKNESYHLHVLKPETVSSEIILDNGL